MMNKTVKFQNIVAEIKQALGQSVPYREILECAQLILSTFESEKTDEAILREGPASLDQIEIHDIWEKDPWQIYWKEPICDHDFESGFQIKQVIFG